MASVVGVIVRKIKDKVYANPGQYSLKTNTKVILETEHGMEFGIVCEQEKNIDLPKETFIGKILRIATENDLKRLENNEAKNKSAYDIVYKKVLEFKLDMKLTIVQYTFDRTKLFIYYTSETRVDFRELIKDLGHILKTRIQMVQIGVRDESKIIGGIGICGRKLCCQTFLKDFSSVTIDMAKDQDLSLNTTKLSGVCGRLMCCLAYEQQQYIDIKKRCPETGTKVSTPSGKGTLVSIDCIKETGLVEYAEGNLKIFPLSQIKKVFEKEKHSHVDKDKDKEKDKEKNKNNDKKQNKK